MGGLLPTIREERGGATSKGTERREGRREGTEREGRVFPPESSE